MPKLEALHTEDAPGAIGPYSQAMRAGQWLMTAGQIGLDPANGQLGMGVEAQTRQVMRNLAAVLDGAGLGFEHVVKTTIFLASMDDFGMVNEIYGDHFQPPYPARSTVEAAGLPKGALVEIDLVACRPD
jgi:2-iminobutanoate/2-iminopropanoate deaminase